MDAMNSILKREFPIEIGGRSFTLCFSMLAVWAFEDKSGVDISTVTDFSGEKPDLTKEEQAQIVEDRIFGKTPRERIQRTLMLLWAGLSIKHPEVSYEQLVGMVFLADMARISPIVSAAFVASISNGQEVEEDDRPTTAAPPAQD